MQENYHHQHRKDHQLNVEYLNTDYQIRVKKFNDYAEVVKKEKQRIKEMEIEYKLLKELLVQSPELIFKKLDEIKISTDFIKQLYCQQRGKSVKKSKTKSKSREQRSFENKQKLLNLPINKGY